MLHNTFGGTSKVMTTSVTTLQIFVEINFEGYKIAIKMSSDKQNLALVIISYQIYLTAKGSFNKFHMK